MTKPIIKLTRVSQSIASLDFSARYTSTRRDELGLLGTSINRISEELNKTISDLRTANIEIQTKMDLQKRFLASVSHDFKTPVGLIRGYAESLSEGMVSTQEQQKEISDIIINEADRLNDLVSDILFIIKNESQIIPLEKGSHDIIRLINQTIKRLSSKKQTKNINITIHMPKNFLVSCDKNKILRVLENLFDNSLQNVTPGGTVDVMVQDKENFSPA